MPEPVLEGPKATYPEVLEGVDLVVTASAEGFSHDLVVKSAAAAADPSLDAVELGLEAAGLTASVSEAGGIQLTDAAGEVVAGAAPPRMWDASAEQAAASGGGLSVASAAVVNDPAPVGVELDGSQLRLIPDAGLLEGPETVYPVTIDPIWSPDTNGWITVSTRFANNSYWKTSHLTDKDHDGDAGVGQACDASNNEANCLSTPFRMHSYFRFNVSTVTQDPYRIPERTRVYFLQKHSALCHNGNLHLMGHQGSIRLPAIRGTINRACTPRPGAR